MPDKNNQTDEEIVKLVQNGDTEIFGNIVERYENKLRRYGRRFLFYIEIVAFSGSCASSQTVIY